MLANEKVKETAAGVVSLLAKTWVSFMFSLIFASAAFALACLAAAFARQEAAEIAFRIAFWFSFAVLCLAKQPMPKEIEASPPEATFWEWGLPVTTGIGFAAWVVYRCVPYMTGLAAGWGLF